MKLERHLPLKCIYLFFNWTLILKVFISKLNLLSLQFWIIPIYMTQCSAIAAITGDLVIMSFLWALWVNKRSSWCVTCLLWGLAMCLNSVERKIINWLVSSRGAELLSNYRIFINLFGEPFLTNMLVFYSGIDISFK